VETLGGPDTRPLPTRRRGRVAIVKSRHLALAVFTLLSLNAIAFLAGSWRLIRYPFELDYGEGIVLWQAAHVFDLKEAYHPLGRYPYIVFHYPPVYHLLSRIVGAPFGDFLIGGRMLSWLAAVGIAILSGLLVLRGISKGRQNPVVAGLAAPLLILQLKSLEWVPYMRVDLTALLIVLFGLFVFLRSDSPFVRVGTGILFVVAVFCKQTMLAAPAAVVVTLLLTGGVGEAVALCCVMAALGLTVLGALTWYTNGEFVRHLFLYNLNPYSLKQLLRALFGNLNETGIIAALALVVPMRALGLPRAPGLHRWPAGSPERARLCLSVYCFTAFLMCLLSGKAGAAKNYFIEWNVSCCMLAAMTIGDCVPFRLERKITVSGLVALLMVAVVGVNDLVRAKGYVDVALGRDSDLNERVETALRALREIRAVPGPVLSEDMVLLARANKDIPWEPAIIAQLAAAGTFDETRALDRVKARSFDLIVVRDLGSDLFYSRRMREAILNAYQVKTVLRHYSVFEPRP
jgi:hypothetical protein